MEAVLSELPEVGQVILQLGARHLHLVLERKLVLKRELVKYENRIISGIKLPDECCFCSRLYLPSYISSLLRLKVVLV